MSKLIDVKEIIQLGNIERSVFPTAKSLTDKDYVNMYLGSGNCGALFDAYGLMNRRYASAAHEEDYYKRMTSTALSHQGHYSRGRFGMDYQLPVLRVAFANNLPNDATNYNQTLNIYDGTLNTQFENDEVRYKTTTFFSPFKRNFMGLEFEWEAVEEICDGAMDLMVEFFDTVKTAYENEFTGQVEFKMISNKKVEAILKVGTATTTVTIVMNGVKKCTANGAILNLEISNHAQILFNISNEINAIDLAHQFYEEKTNAIASWHKRWGDSIISISDEKIQKIWLRSLYYNLATFSPEQTAPFQPTGWNLSLWSFHFPQDFSYIHPALLRLGHYDIAMAKIEFYKSRLKSAMENTKRIFRTKGVFWPWEFPIAEDFTLMPDFNLDSVDDYQSLKIPGENVVFANWFQFEIHSPAYVSRMAYETAMHLLFARQFSSMGITLEDRRPIKSKKDVVKWVKEFVVPIITETANFYEAISHENENGKWDIFVKPSMGQDERGEPNNKNYYCALLSATYAIGVAVNLEKILDDEKFEILTDKMRKIIKTGYNFDDVYNQEYEIYFASKQANEKGVLGLLKHPVSINSLFAIPINKTITSTFDSAPVLNAYEIRHDLTNNNDHPEFIAGWTLAACWVASSHLGKGEDLANDFSKMPGDFMDKDCYEFYESSVLHWMQYYTTTHGLFLQAVNDAVVSDYFGKIEIEKAIPHSWQVEYQGLYAFDTDF